MARQGQFAGYGPICTTLPAPFGQIATILPESATTLPGLCNPSATPALFNHCQHNQQPAQVRMTVSPGKVRWANQE